MNAEEFSIERMNLTSRDSGGVPGRNVVAVLGPTNTGKTHLAIERMLAHGSGIIGLPLRLLAREVYNRIVARVGVDAVALITGEEKIIPAGARFRVCTVEAMPSETDATFLAIDEIQLAADLERGHVFTDRILNLRGREETLLLGAATMRGIIEKLIPGVNVVTRPRMSMLTYAGPRKITRLPARSAIVAFSADEDYAIAELIRRQHGGAAVVLGSLSPRTRNAQVELFQSGDVDFLVATDAIGMGLNLDVNHVAFASDRKFDGYQYRRLNAGELGQIAGRAGRHMRDGTFGVTGRAEPFEDALVEALESHRFDAVKTVQWRNRDLDFATLDTLRRSLDRLPQREGLSKAPPSVDVDVLERVARDEAVRALADSRAQVSLLWDICQVPDYRKIAPANHAELVATMFGFLAREGAIPDDWFAAQVSFADRTDGDIDTLANRIAHIRTWTFAANRPNWLHDPGHWQERTRAIEDRLSDALHERLTARFVDRRTSVLMRRLKENAMLDAEINSTGDVLVEGQHVGSLEGFRFTPDANADGPEAKALRTAAQKALVNEIQNRAERLSNGANTEFVLSGEGALRWQGAIVAKLLDGDDPLKPRLILLADDTLNGPTRDRVQARIDLWLSTHVGTLLKPLFDLQSAESLSAPARGIAFRLAENFGTLERSVVADDVKSLDQDARAGLRALGVRFGAYHIYAPALLKPAPSSLLAMLWALKNGGLDVPGLADLARLAASGRTSVPVEPSYPPALYQIVGYKVAGTRAVRIDILERLADIIRPLLAWRPTTDQPEPPEGAINGFGFTQTVAMTSLLGCSGEDFASVLRALGYRMERRPAPLKASTSQSNAPDEASAPAESDEHAVTASEAAEVSGEAQSADIVAAETSADDAASPTADTAPAAQNDATADADTVPSEEKPATDTPADDAAGTDSAEPVAAETDAAEPEMIEIWRPARKAREGDHRPQRGGNRGNQNRRGAAAAAPAAATQGERRGDDRRPRRENERGSEGNREQRRPRGDDNRGHKGRDRDGRRDRQERREGGGAARFSTEAPKTDRRNKTADPNSPFAALAALKAELESKDRGK